MSDERWFNYSRSNSFKKGYLRNEDHPGQICKKNFNYRFIFLLTNQDSFYVTNMRTIMRFIEKN